MCYIKKNSYFTLKTSWKSTYGYPKYEGEKQIFNIPYDPKACFIIECKGLKMEPKDKKDKKKGEKLVLSDVGWSLLPIFQKGEMEDAAGHVIHGYFQVPLFAGRPNKKMIEELMETDIDAANILDRETSGKGKNGKYKLKAADGNAMLLIKLLDCQLYGMAKTFLKDLNPRYTYGFDEKKYKYEKEKHKDTSHVLSKSVPKGKKPEDYEEELNQRLATMLRLEDAGVELLDMEDGGDDDEEDKGKDKKKKSKKDGDNKKGKKEEDDDGGGGGGGDDEEGEDKEDDKADD